jgi:hypothetical protein
MKKAQQAAGNKRTITNLPRSTRNRQQLYEVAERQNIPSRSRMGKSALIAAIRDCR